MIRQKKKRVYRRKSVINKDGASAPKPPAPSLHREIPTILRRALAKKRMSKEELARKSGLSIKLVNDILEGKFGRLYLQRLRAIADALELDYADLVKRRAVKDA